MSNDGYNSLKYKRVKLELRRLYTWILVDLPHLKPQDVNLLQVRPQESRISRLGSVTNCKGRSEFYKPSLPRLHVKSSAVPKTSTHPLRYSSATTPLTNPNSLQSVEDIQPKFQLHNLDQTHLRRAPVVQKPTWSRDHLYRSIRLTLAKLNSRCSSLLS